MYTCETMYQDVFDIRKRVFNLVQHYVHLNLSIALLLGLLTFVSGIEAATEYRVSLYTLYVNVIIICHICV